MTFDCEDDKIVHVLAAVSDIKIIVKIQPHHLPEALGANECKTCKTELIECVVCSSCLIFLA